MLRLHFLYISYNFSAFQILVNEGLISLLTDELTKYLTTMDFEHNNMEHTDILSEAVDLLKVKEKAKYNTKTDLSKDQTPSASTSTTEGKSNLFMRRKSLLSSKNEDELKVVIERDNMIVGFVDAVDSDASDDSLSEDESSLPRRKCLKRARSQSPIVAKKVSTFISVL